ncbi:DUF2345 domain-containing protein, partial [Xenorhabdus szentirmaii]
KRGQEHIKLSTEYGGKSQLNLGHIVDSERKKRGDGFELRTDSWGAIRADKGLFISADAQPLAKGNVLDMSDALEELEAAKQEAAGLRKVAQEAKAELADLAAQTQFMEQKIAELNQRVLLLSAPAGIASVTPGHLQLSAGENLIATSGHNADLSIGKSFRLAARKALSFFAQQMGIKLFAAAGKVEIQAQSDELEMMAKENLTIASTDKEVSISAKQSLTLNCGGSYIRLTEGEIEIATSGNVSLKCGVLQKMGAASNPLDFNLPKGCPSVVKSAASEQSAIVPL